MAAGFGSVPASDAHEEEESDLWTAAGDGDLEVVRAAIESGMAPDLADENGYTPLHAAASYGRCEVLSFLLEAGANPNITDPDGDTPLHVCECGTCVEKLIKAGADFHKRNASGNAPIQEAFVNGQSKVVGVLEEAYKAADDPLPSPRSVADEEEEEGREWIPGVAEYDEEDEDDEEGGVDGVEGGGAASAAFGGGGGGE